MLYGLVKQSKDLLYNTMYSNISTSAGPVYMPLYTAAITSLYGNEKNIQSMKFCYLQQSYNSIPVLKNYS